MECERIVWQWDGRSVDLAMDWQGDGPIVLLLPALSSISTRREMRPLQQRLGAQFRTVAADWPGFGDQPRATLDWRPETYRAFLAFLIGRHLPSVYGVIAAGHGATYALAHSCAYPNSFARLVLLAPTWRGPLPTMMNGQRPVFDRIRRILDQPVVGPLFYRLNVNRFVIRYMAAGHVYSDRSWLHGERLREKLAVTRARGARFSSARFVTGKLDPLAARAEFLDLAHRTGVQMLMIYGAETPPRSRAEMDVLAAQPSMRAVRLPSGKLALHEEFADVVADPIAAFLSDCPAPIDQGRK
jgi:pimeloyl-ACP methyl ester carboxylesterase